MGCGISKQMKRVPTGGHCKREDCNNAVNKYSLYTVKEELSELEHSCKPSNRASVVV